MWTEDGAKDPGCIEGLPTQEPLIRPVNNFGYNRLG